MKCFNHVGADAVGVSKSCGRGLCRDCVTQVGLSVSCKGGCETVVQTMNDLVERGRTAYTKTSATQMRTGIITILLGTLFLIFGIATGIRKPWDYFLPAAGILFALLGVSLIFSALRLKQK
jgi:hypothetical protein